MKSKTKQRIAKWFAGIVVLVMIFQVLMPLFNSGVIDNAKTAVVATPTSQTINVKPTATAIPTAVASGAKAAIEGTPVTVQTKTTPAKK